MTGDRELRATFPGWDTTSRFGDAFIIQFLEAPAGPDNRWTGNAYGYFDPRLKGLVEIYQRSLTQQEQLDSVRRLTEFIGAELPVLPMYYEADYVGIRKGVKAFDDIKGGAGSSAPYGLFSRNAYLWSIE